MVAVTTAGRVQRLLAAGTSDFWRAPIDVAGCRQQWQGMNRERVCEKEVVGYYGVEKKNQKLEKWFMQKKKNENHLRSLNEIFLVNRKYFWFD